MPASSTDIETLDQGIRTRNLPHKSLRGRQRFTGACKIRSIGIELVFIQVHLRVTWHTVGVVGLAVIGDMRRCGEGGKGDHGRSLRIIEKSFAILRC
jgi:hypothetical protein